MTFPLSGADPGETEYSHGRGMGASARQRAQRVRNLATAYPTGDADGPFEMTVYEHGKAVQRTDPADPKAVADLFAEPNTVNNRTQTKWTREK